MQKAADWYREEASVCARFSLLTCSSPVAMHPSLTLFCCSPINACRFEMSVRLYPQLPVGGSCGVLRRVVVELEAQPPVQETLHGLIFQAGAQRPGTDARQTKQLYYARVKAVYDKHKANPITALAPILIQGPVFVGAFTGLRSLAMHKACPL